MICAQPCTTVFLMVYVSSVDFVFKCNKEDYLSCRKQGKELEKMRKVLEASDSELKSTRRDFASLRESSRNVKQDLLRLVGDMSQAASSRVSSSSSSSSMPCCLTDRDVVFAVQACQRMSFWFADDCASVPGIQHGIHQLLDASIATPCFFQQQRRATPPCKRQCRKKPCEQLRSDKRGNLHEWDVP
jgi:hypothetical protein